MNSLERDINGMLVLVRPEYRVIPAPPPSTKVHRNDTRLFAVKAANPGEGAYRHAQGRIVYGHWLDTGARGAIDGMDIVRAARQSDLLGVHVALQCTYCDGTGSVGNFICTVCLGSGLYAPLVPLEA